MIITSGFHCIYTYTHTHTQICVCVYIYIYIYIYIYTYKTYIYTHTNTNEKLRGRSEILLSFFIHSLLCLLGEKIGPEIELNVVLDVMINAVREI